MYICVSSIYNENLRLYFSASAVRKDARFEISLWISTDYLTLRLHISNRILQQEPFIDIAFSVRSLNPSHLCYFYHHEIIRLLQAIQMVHYAVISSLIKGLRD